MHKRAFDRCIPRIKRLTIAGFARIDRGGCVWLRDKGNPPRPETEEVLGDHIAGAPVVDPDKIVVAAPRIGNDRAVEQHHRDPSLIESPCNSLIHIVLGG